MNLGSKLWGRNLVFASKSSVFVPFVGGNLVFASKSIVFVPFSGFLCWKWYFLPGSRGLWEFVVASGNSAGISGISGEMGEAGAPRTLPSTRAWGQDDGSSHKLPQIKPPLSY